MRHTVLLTSCPAVTTRRVAFLACTMVSAAMVRTRCDACHLLQGATSAHDVRHERNDEAMSLFVWLVGNSSGGDEWAISNCVRAYPPSAPASAAGARGVRIGFQVSRQAPATNAQRRGDRPSATDMSSKRSLSRRFSLRRLAFSFRNQREPARTAQQICPMQYSRSGKGDGQMSAHLHDVIPRW